MVWPKTTLYYQLVKLTKYELSSTIGRRCLSISIEWKSWKSVPYLSGDWDTSEEVSSVVDQRLSQFHWQSPHQNSSCQEPGKGRRELFQKWDNHYHNLNTVNKNVYVTEWKNPRKYTVLPSHWDHGKSHSTLNQYFCHDSEHFCQSISITCFLALYLTISISTSVVSQWLLLDHGQRWDDKVE